MRKGVKSKMASIILLLGVHYNDMPRFQCYGQIWLPLLGKIIVKLDDEREGTSSRVMGS